MWWNGTETRLKESGPPPPSSSSSYSQHFFLFFFYCRCCCYTWVDGECISPPPTSQLNENTGLSFRAIAQSSRSYLADDSIAINSTGKERETHLNINWNSNWVILSINPKSWVTKHLGQRTHKNIHWGNPTPGLNSGSTNFQTQ